MDLGTGVQNLADWVPQALDGGCTDRLRRHCNNFQRRIDSLGTELRNENSQPEWGESGNLRNGDQGDDSAHNNDKDSEDGLGRAKGITQQFPIATDDQTILTFHPSTAARPTPKPL